MKNEENQFKQFEQDHKNFHAELKKSEEWYKKWKAESKEEAQKHILEHIEELEKEIVKCEKNFENEREVLKASEKIEYEDYVSSLRGGLQWLREDLEDLEEKYK